MFRTWSISCEMKGVFSESRLPCSTLLRNVLSLNWIWLSEESANRASAQWCHHILAYNALTSELPFNCRSLGIYHCGTAFSMLLVVQYNGGVLHPYLPSFFLCPCLCIGDAVEILVYTTGRDCCYRLSCKCYGEFLSATGRCHSNFISQRSKSTQSDSAGS